MAGKSDEVTIKKYANRRLYNTGTSTYVTLEDLAEMVKRGEEFTVQDAKTGEDITHAVLTQIIFELENKDGQNMLPVAFLRQLISFYGDQMQMILPSFLEQSMAAFSLEQGRMREQLTTAFGKGPLTGGGMMGGPMMGMDAPMKMIEEQVRRNTEMFQSAMRMFTTFPNPGGEQAGAGSQKNGGGAAEEHKTGSDDLRELREQIAAMQKKIDSMDR